MSSFAPVVGHWSVSSIGSLTPVEKTLCPLDKGMDESQSQSGCCTEERSLCPYCKLNLNYSATQLVT
jgi:hypothetical protein